MTGMRAVVVEERRVDLRTWSMYARAVRIMGDNFDNDALWKELRENVSWFRNGEVSDKSRKEIWDMFAERYVRRDAAFGEDDLITVYTDGKGEEAAVLWGITRGYGVGEETERIQGLLRADFAMEKQELWEKLVKAVVWIKSLYAVTNETVLRAWEEAFAEYVPVYMDGGEGVLLFACRGEYRNLCVIKRVGGQGLLESSGPDEGGYIDVNSLYRVRAARRQLERWGAVGERVEALKDEVRKEYMVYAAGTGY